MLSIEPCKAFSHAGNPAVPTYRALVHGIRIDALDADERRKQ
jgi:hypothetical protein